MEPITALEAITALAERLRVIGHNSRYNIVKYCSKKPCRFSDIIFDLKLNPASFKFHSRVLIECELIEKLQRGLYQTTELGNLLLKLVEQASILQNN
jgi:predicted transcriptional regulator